MNRFVRSAAYVKTRAVTGAIFIVLGAVLIWRTVSIAGLGVPSIAPIVLGLALAGLGVLRVRDYLRLRGQG